jgi:hypothetical protein
LLSQQQQVGSQQRVGTGKKEQDKSNDAALALAARDLALAKEEQLRVVGGEYIDGDGVKRGAIGAMDLMDAANW